MSLKGFWLNLFVGWPYLRSYVADDVFIMMSDIGSNCHSLTHESDLKYCFEMNLVREKKNCCDIVRYEHRDRK